MEGRKDEEFEVVFEFSAPLASTTEAFAVISSGYEVLDISVEDVRFPEERGDVSLDDPVALNRATDEFWGVAVTLARSVELAAPFASVAETLPVVMLDDVKFPSEDIPPRAEDEEFKVALDCKAVAF